MTPEGRIKERVKRLFKEFADLYYHMPVQNGMGAPTLDFICCYRGRYFAVETKAGRGQLTDRQRVTAAAIETAGGVVFKVSNEAELRALELWLESVA